MMKSLNIKGGILNISGYFNKKNSLKHVSPYIGVKAKMKEETMFKVYSYRLSDHTNSYLK